MALFSLRHSVKSFSEKVRDAERIAKQGQTAAHLRYITRASAARHVERVRVSGSDAQVAAEAEAEAVRKKGRVAERFIIALPVEATPDQRVELARAFAEHLTHSKAGYVFAVHDQHGNDVNNPHFHLVAFDAYERTGGRGRPRSVIGMAKKGALERTAKMWADTHNEMMAAWGYGPETRISHLSYAARGIDRVATLHEGPGARAMAAQGKSPATKKQWRNVDGGHTRAEANAVIREINNLKEKADERQSGTRLGRRDAAHPEKRGDSRGPHQPAHARGGRRPAKDHRTGAQDGGTGGPCRTPPPFLRRAGKAPERDPTPTGPTAPAKPSPAFLAPLRRVVRRRSLRRSFRALVMLRDTLRARLRTAERAPETVPQAPVAAPLQLRGEAQRRGRSDEITLE